MLAPTPCLPAAAACPTGATALDSSDTESADELLSPGSSVTSFEFDHTQGQEQAAPRAAPRRHDVKGGRGGTAAAVTSALQRGGGGRGGGAAGMQTITEESPHASPYKQAQQAPRPQSPARGLGCQDLVQAQLQPSLVEGLLPPRPRHASSPQRPTLPALPDYAQHSLRQQQQQQLPEPSSSTASPAPLLAAHHARQDSVGSLALGLAAGADAGRAQGPEASSLGAGGGAGDEGDAEGSESSGESSGVGGRHAAAATAAVARAGARPGRAANLAELEARMATAMHQITLDGAAPGDGPFDISDLWAAASSVHSTSHSDTTSLQAGTSSFEDGGVTSRQQQPGPSTSAAAPPQPMPQLRQTIGGRGAGGPQQQRQPSPQQQRAASPGGGRGGGGNGARSAASSPTQHRAPAQQPRSRPGSPMKAGAGPRAPRPGSAGGNGGVAYSAGALPGPADAWLPAGAAGGAGQGEPLEWSAAAGLAGGAARRVPPPSSPRVQVGGSRAGPPSSPRLRQQQQQAGSEAGEEGAAARPPPVAFGRCLPQQRPRSAPHVRRGSSCSAYGGGEAQGAEQPPPPTPQFTFKPQINRHSESLISVSYPKDRCGRGISNAWGGLRAMWA